MGKKRLTIILVLASVIIVILCFNGLAGLITEVDSREEIISSREKNYSFNATTILNSLSEGNPNVFKFQIATPDPSISSQLGPVLWKQTDYLQVAHTFYEEILEDNLATWHFDELTFSAACEDAPKGPQAATFHLFRKEHTRKKESRFEHFVYIEPQKGQLDLVETEYYPNIHVPSTLNLNKSIISVELSMYIAEDNGGQAFRGAVDNVCNIFVQKLENAWLVHYFSDNSVFRIRVDDQNGDHKLAK